MAQVQTEEKTLLKFSASRSTVPAVSRSSGLRVSAGVIQAIFFPVADPQARLDAESFCGLSKCPASPCYAVLRVLCSA